MSDTTPGRDTGSARPRPPLIRSESAGSVNDLCEMVAKLYEASHPGMEATLVYSPTHTSQPTNVLERRMAGYDFVAPSELGQWGEFFGEDESRVRIGDTVVMAVPKDIKAAITANETKRALSELRRVDREYHDQVSSLEGQGESGAVHKGLPTGKVVLREEEREIVVTNENSPEGGETT